MLGSILSAGANLIGGLFGKSSQDKANKNVMDAAKNSIQWRVEDAKKAGVHPVYALGAPTMSVGSVVGDTSMPAAMSNIGQDISRAMASTATSQSRMDSQVQALTLKRMDLENTLLASQIARINQPATPPAYPGGSQVIGGQGDVPIVSVDPSRTTHFVNPRGDIIKTANLPDAQVYQDRYGEVAENIYGMRNWLHDNFPTVMKLMNKEFDLRSGKWKN